MKSFSIVSVAVLLLAVSFAHENSLEKKIVKPSQWLSPSQLEQVPSVDEISVEKLEKMPVEKGSEIVEKIYHLSQINLSLRPNFVPNPSTTPVQLYKSNGQKVTTTLDKMAIVSAQLPDFGDKEVTIVITGMPAITESIKKAKKKLIEAYLQRYSMTRSLSEKNNRSGEKSIRSSSEEDSRESQKQKPSTGNLVVIDLGDKLNNLKRMALLDTKQTGEMLASAIKDMIEKNDIALETVHIVAQGIAAHVAGAAGNEILRRTGQKLRRITALDPSKLFAKDPHTLAGLKRGDAEFVDAIHTNAYGLGSIERNGDVDFYPNGPSKSVPGAKNVIEASMRATRYFAETVQPGRERNFPAITANSLKEVLNNDGYRRRVYMGIDAASDVKGDYILEVNENSPFGKRKIKSWKQYQDNE